MNNFFRLKRALAQSTHCLVNANGRFFYIDLSEHSISEISQGFVKDYSRIARNDIIRLNASIRDLLGFLPGFSMEDN